MSFMRQVSGIFLVIFCCLEIASGQATTSLRGHITDASGAVIPGANVQLTLVSTGANRSGQTDATGEYQFLQLTPGRYTLKVNAEGFAPAEAQGMDLLVGQPATQNMVLSLQTVTTQVTVETNVQPVLNTTDATLGNAFAEKQVQSLPIEGRNVPDLLSLQPGVTYLGRTDENSGTQAVGNNSDDSRSGAVNGGRSDQSNITLDGVDVNDINNSYAFTSVLRVTQDSVGEFRVTTSNPDAAEGRSSGAQVGLITRSGTNQLHGAVYEYNRSNLLEANDFFNKQVQLLAGQPNTPTKLIRNVFGAAVGGPVKHDRLFYFLNYEGRRDIQGTVNARTVPLSQYRAGNIQYNDVNGGVFNLSPQQLTAMDPQGIGPNSSIQQILGQYPQPNDFVTLGDGLNTGGFRFPYNIHRSYDTYIARFDWNITHNGNHTVFWRGNLQGDNEPVAPQFPGQPPSSSTLTNSRGFAVGYTAVLTSNLVNTVRYGLTRQGVDDAGLSKQPHVAMAAVDDPEAFSRTTSYIIPVQNFVDDLSWTKHDHTLQFGANIRFIDDQRKSDADSYPDGQMNQGWLANSSTVANSGAAFDPPVYGYPTVGDAFVNSYNSALLELVGIVTEGDAVYNYNKQGTPLPLGTLIKRDYRWNEYEFYAQDSWKATHNLTLTYGLRWAFLQPPAETSGTQVGTCKVVSGRCSPYSLTDFYEQSAAQAASGSAANAIGEIGFNLNGRYNGQPDFWNMSKHDIGPRIALAYSPTAPSGFWNKIFGDGKSGIRAGYSLVYDHFGAAIVNTFDTTGSYGLSSNISNAPGSVFIGSAPRFTNINTIPASILPPAPAGGFPAVPINTGPNSFIISWGLDQKIKTPYSHLIDFSIARELHNGSSLEISYVGRLAHRLLVQEDVAMPTNLHAAGVNYFGPASQLAKMTRANVPVSAVQPIPYWEQVFPALDGADIGYGPLSATQNVYEVFNATKYNETYGLYELDVPDSITNAGVNPNQTYPSYRFYHDQYSALYAWRSIGSSNYQALEVVYRQRFGGGVEADFNYSLSKSLDITSQAERLSSSGGINYAQIMNSWEPNQLYGPSDFDVRHQINANYIWEIPVGRGRHFLSSMGRIEDLLIGGWQTTGIVRWTSGFPFAVNNGAFYPTNWDIQGFATQISKIPSRAAKRGKLTQRFADPAAVFQAFDFTLPGGSGTRNPLRGDGYYSWDTGLNKTFAITERAKLQLRWEMFNVTNSVRFDSHSISSTLDNQTNFGQASTPLTNPRLAQFAARVEF